MSQAGFGQSIRKLVTRVLATGALLGVYVFSTFAVGTAVMTASPDTAMAQRGRGGRGGGRGGRGVGRGRGVVRGRGVGRGRGRGLWRGGVWWPWVAPGWCHYPPTSRRVVCPFY